VKSHDSHFVMQCLLKGAECSNTVPASHALTVPSRVLRSGADSRPEKLPAGVPLPELKERGGNMFSGHVSGAAVGSGRGVATTAPTYELIKAVIGVIEELPPELFGRWAAHRPCGLLRPALQTQRGGDADLRCLGLSAAAICAGRADRQGCRLAAAKVPAKITGAQATAKKAAARKGADPSVRQRRACSATPCDSRPPLQRTLRERGESSRKLTRRCPPPPTRLRQRCRCQSHRHPSPRPRLHPRPLRHPSLPQHPHPRPLASSAYISSA
jgi:hypothetical protein